MEKVGLPPPWTKHDKGLNSGLAPYQSKLGTGLRVFALDSGLDFSLGTV